MSVVVVFGASGCGKTSVGRSLADKFRCAFVDADDCHPPSNVGKMSRGTPLTDEDRLPWLTALHGIITGWNEEAKSNNVGVTSYPEVTIATTGDGTRAKRFAGVLACSALKKTYRDILRGSIVKGERSVVTEGQSSPAKHCIFVLLRASEKELTRRIMARTGHFMPSSLVRSQLDILELPDEQECAVVIETDGSDVEDVVIRIIDKLEHIID